MCVMCRKDENDAILKCMNCGSQVCLDAKTDGPIMKKGMITRAGRVFCCQCYESLKGEPEDDGFMEEDETTGIMVEAR